MASIDWGAIIQQYGTNSQSAAPPAADAPAIDWGEIIRQHAPKQAEPQPISDKEYLAKVGASSPWYTALSSLGNAATLNLGRNLGAAARTLRTGKSFEHEYEFLKKVDEASARENPATNLIYGAIGAAAPLIAAPIASAPTMLGRAAQSAALGAGMAGASELADSKDIGAAARAAGVGAAIGGVAAPVVEGAARGVGAVANSLGGLTRSGAATRAIRDAAGDMTAPQLDAMEALMRDAQAAGLPLTRAEAAQAVTNGATSLADLQRLVEGQGGLRSFMSERPGQVEAAGRRAVEQIAKTPTNPSMIGAKTAEAADAIIREQQAAINAQTRPLYDNVATRRGGPPVGNYLAKDPIYKATLNEIRGDPVLNRTIADLPDDNAAVIDLVQRRMGERAQNARVPGQASTSNLAAANLEDARGAAITAAERITGSRPEKGIVGTYEQARFEQAQLRDQTLAPLMAGPIGKLAERPETRSAIEALFPRNPVPNSAGEVLDAVSRLSEKNPWAARQLVRAHVESVFNTATKELQGGLNQFGGANFKAQLTGNAQQAENLAAAIRALPNGDAILPGFDRMLEIMGATGQRQRIGSQTAFNQELQASLKSGSVIGEAATLAAGGGLRLPARIQEAFQRWNLGRNTDELARLLTDPQAGPAFRKLLAAKDRSALVNATARIVAIASASSSARKKER
jgi:hypothetical protein